MPFVPHTQNDVQAMLAAIGIQSIDELFDEIPTALKINSLPEVPPGLSEMEVARILQQRAHKDQAGLCFIGAGAYEHHIPAAIWDIVGRGEFYSAYTPYQAEASQGTLQLLYEFQTMMVNLTGLDVANASLYDGASGLAEAILMAVRANTRSKSKRILVPRSVNPAYRKAVHSCINHQGIRIEEVAFDLESGRIDHKTLQSFSGQDITAVVIQQPNFFGGLEEVDAITDWAHAQGALVIAVVNPIALALLKEPGAWGKAGADIACGEGQPLGVPLSSGGPYVGFLCCKQNLVRQMPGRIVGRTVDIENKPAFTLTLQAREQHIRRSKATSNICTNQSLLVIAATIYMSLLGAEGMRRVAASSHHNAILLQQKLTAVPGVNAKFKGPIFHEFVIQLKKPVAEVLDLLAETGIQGGYSLTADYPELGESLLVCATETKNEADIDEYQKQLGLLLKHTAGLTTESCK